MKSSNDRRKTMKKRVLEGVKVADFCRVIVGPLTTKTLADHGATVVRIESRKALDLYRTFGPTPDTSGHITQWSTGKMGVTIDLTNPKGVELVKKIIAWADVVVENYAGGVMERLGLGYEELKKVNPQIIMLSSCMQGQTGPFSRHPGWGFQLSALSGFSHITGWPDRPPPEMGVYTDFITPSYNVMIILAALLYRKRTGKGQFIDTAQFETGAQFMTPLILDYTINGRVAERMGNKLSYAAPHNAYRCKDEYTWCRIPLSTDKDWEGLCAAMGNPAWAKDSKFSTADARKKNGKELAGLIEEWTGQYTPENVLALLTPHQVEAVRLSTGAYKPARNPAGTYRCFNEERWCAISVFTDEEWMSFCKVIGRPALADNPKFSTILRRKEHEEELDEIVTRWTVRRKAEDVQDTLQKAGVSAGLLETGEDQLEHDPQTKHRNTFPEMDHPTLGKHHAVASPYIMSKTPCVLTRAPLLGEHNEYVFKEILGMTEEDIVELLMAGALE
jgi:crotonobetainyl-CoA:carnitine CoA-transferase CaiB-like acyl-CoA transferase